MNTPDSMQCPGCFESKASSICENCGYDESLKRSPLVLPHHTFLSNGRYQIGRVLGRPGGFGITYLAFDSRLQSLVAIKEYLPRDLSGRDGDQLTVSPHSGEEGELFQYGVGKFLEEARTLAKFDHPNVVRVRDFFEENGTAYLVMDYCRGLPLSQYVSQQNGGKISVIAAISILQPLLDALRELHKKGYLHRDVKPQNIYLSESGRPILLDFGAARHAMGDRSRSLSVVLSEGYAPLEQYQRNGMQGPWTDVYGAVATFYNLITGKVPPSAIDRINNPDVGLDDSTILDQNIKMIIENGLRPDCSSRIQSVEELQSYLGSSGVVISKGADPDRSGANQKEAIDLWTTSPPIVEETRDAKWEAIAPYYLSSLTGKKEMGNDPDPKMITWIMSVFAIGSGLAASAVLAYLLSNEIGYDSKQFIGFIVFIAPIICGFVYYVLTKLPSFVDLQKYQRAKYYLPIFRSIEAGDRVNKTNLTFLFIPIPWLGYWGLWRHLFVVLSILVAIESSPYFVSAIAGTHHDLSLLLYRAKEKGGWQFGLWLGMSFLYNKALFDSIKKKIAPFIDAGINDHAVIYEKTKPRLWRAILAVFIFILMVISPGILFDQYDSELAALNDIKDHKYEKALNVGVSLGQDGKTEEASEWISPLSDIGYPPAQYAMGKIYSEGKAPVHAPRNLYKSYELYRRSAEAGYTLGKSALARALYYGRGVPVNLAESFMWFNKAAQDGDLDSTQMVGYMYWKGEGVKSDTTKAFEYIQRAANSGHARAQALLGLFYDAGYGVKIDKKKAFEYYTESTKAGYPLGLYYLGVKYFYGEDVQMDKSKGIDLFLRAAEAGLPAAQYQIGSIYVAGKDVTQDMDNGIKWLREASSQGYEDATTMLKRLGM